MKQRLIKNNSAVSNVLAYLFSFTIATMIMIASVYITRNMIDNKTAEVAGMEAQSVANRVANAILEIASSSQTSSGLNYKKTLNLPETLAGLRYYIEVNDYAVFVNTTNGLVKKSCPIYNAALNMRMSTNGLVYPQNGKIDIAFDKPDYVYKFDFGTGNSETHSPVEPGYIMVTPSTMDSSRDPNWYGNINPDEDPPSNFPYRIPILINNTSPEDLLDVPVNIVLTPNDIAHPEKVQVVHEDGASENEVVYSNIIFSDPKATVAADITINPTTWQITWKYRNPSASPYITVKIVGLSDGYSKYNVVLDLDAFKLNDKIKPIEIIVGTDDTDPIELRFITQEAIKTLEGGNLLQGSYTISLSGKLTDGTTFIGKETITVNAGDVYYVATPADGGDDTHPGTSQEPFATISKGVLEASSGDTVFVKNGNYYEKISVSKKINLIGESRDGTIIDGTGYTDYISRCWSSQANEANIDSFSIINGAENQPVPPQEDYDPADGIELDACSYVTVTNCHLTKNMDGIVIKNSASFNIIDNCLIENNSGKLCRPGGWIEIPFPVNGGENGYGYGDGIQIWGETSGYSENNNIIQYCIIKDHNGYVASGVTYRNYVDHNKIINCDIHNNTQGIYIISDKETIAIAHNNTFERCNIYNNNHGIYISQSDNNTIQNSTIYKNGIGQQEWLLETQRVGDGIHLDDDSCYNTIDNCSIYDNTHCGVSIGYAEGIGSFFKSAKNNDVKNCHIYNNNFGIFGTDLAYTTIVGCHINNSIADVNGNNGVGVYFTSDDVLEDSSYNSIIDCEINESDNMGVVFAGRKLHDNTISNCKIYKHIWAGISLQKGTHHNNIINCDIHENIKDGINIWSYVGTLAPHENIISGCYIWNNGENGTAIVNQILADPNNRIEKCQIFDNQYGINLDGSQHNVIDHCNIFSNTYYGIYLNSKNSIMWASYNEIKYCNIYWNDDFGIRAEPQTESNEIYYNNFEENANDNGVAEYQAYDGSWGRWIGGVYHYKNSWDDTSNGNYWSEWHSPPYPPYYEIDGHDDSQDNHPQVSKYTDYPDPNVVQVNDSYHDYGYDTRIKDDVDGYHFKNIQDAIDAVTTEPPTGEWNWGRVLVYPGTYTISDKITISKNYLNLTKVEDGTNNNEVIINGPDQSTDIFEIVAKNHINISGFTIQNGNRGIYIGSQGSPTQYINITNCILKNNKEGIFIERKSGWKANKLHNISGCDIISNINYGLHISNASTENKIYDCTISGTSDAALGYGIYIENADYNEIINGAIKDNVGDGICIIKITGSSSNNKVINVPITGNIKNGISLRGGAKNNEISKCKIENNDKKGVYILNSEKNKITSCTIFGNKEYGVYIDSGTNNEIYHNDFSGNNPGNAYVSDDAGANTWDNGYSTPFNYLSDGGNHWYDFDDITEEAFDYKHGPNQDQNGGDGIVDNSYTINGENNKDHYPFGGSRFVETRPYFIDYWNPNGESLFLVKVSVPAHSQKYVYLYYGYQVEDITNKIFYKHTSGDISIFYDDFVLLDNTIWNKGGFPQSQEGIVEIKNTEYVVTKTPLMSVPEAPQGEPPVSTTSNARYIVEARMQTNSGTPQSQGNMILLAQTTDPQKSYLVSVNENPDYPTNCKLQLHKNNAPISVNVLLKTSNLPLPDANPWFRFKSDVHLSKRLTRSITSGDTNDQSAFIDSYLYNYTTFSYEGNISYLDSYWENSGIAGDPDGDDVNDGAPWMDGAIGLGCGLIGGQAGDVIKVDWIRVLKAPTTEPTISVGSEENVSYGWKATVNAHNWVSSGSFEDPYHPGLLLRDYNFGWNGVFVVKGLAANQVYTVTITMGAMDAPNLNSNGWSVLYSIDDEASYSSVLDIIDIAKMVNGKFLTKWFTFTTSSTFDGNLYIKFALHTSVVPGAWIVNSMTIEKGEKGIELIGG